MAAAPSRVTPMAFLGLLGDNASLVVVESVAYLSTFLLLLHVHSSGKRNAAVWVAAMFQVLLVELFLHSDDRWHAQSLLMAVPDRLPLYTVLLQAQLYYTAFVATSRLQIDVLFQPFAMGTFVVLLALPLELLGAKFLWWTWHDTDPLLADRLLGIPCHALFYCYYFAFAFSCVHHVLRRNWLTGDYCKEDQWASERAYVLLMPFLTTLLAAGLLILGYYCPVRLLGIQAQVSLFMLIGLSLLLCWIADRERGLPGVQDSLDPVAVYDSDWLYSCIDHAVNQMVFLLYFVLLLLVLFINPTEIVSMGHHQPLGHCLERQSYYSLIGMRHHRRKYLCAYDFDEDFTLCNVPMTQLLHEGPSYMICGRGYNNFATYVALVAGSFVGLNVLFYHVLKRPHVVTFHRRQ